MTSEKPATRKAAVIGLSSINPTDWPQLDFTVAREISGIMTGGLGNGMQATLCAIDECAASCLNITSDLIGSGSVTGIQDQMGDFLRNRARSQMSYMTEIVRLASATMSELLTSSHRLVKATA